MTDILVPFEQEGTKAVVRAWLKAVGDAVEENDPLVELETDKVTQEVHATSSGVLLEIVLQPDAEAIPGAVLGRLGARPSSPVAIGEGEASKVVPTARRDAPPFVTTKRPGCRRACDGPCASTASIRP